MFRYCFHQECESLFEASRSRGTPLKVSQAHHDELVRGDDQHILTARPVHGVRLIWNRKRAVPVYPKEAAINGTVSAFHAGANVLTTFTKPSGKIRLPFQ